MITVPETQTKRPQPKPSALRIEMLEPPFCGLLLIAWCYTIPKMPEQAPANTDNWRGPPGVGDTAIKEEEGVKLKKKKGSNQNMGLT
jgi:hypothetical protein